MKKKGSRVTPKGTQDPNARPRIVAHVGGSPEEIAAFAASVGAPVKALPGSGYCMSCGKKMVPPPLGPDIDHAVCHACFPEDLREEWEGRQVDHARVDLNEGTIEEIPFPEDPFDG